jgi:hypothetical protein
MKPKPYLSKWTLVMPIKVRRFDTQAEAEAERDNAVECGERSFRRLPRGRERAS